MLKLKLQYFGHLMRRVDSLEKTLMLGGIGGRRRRGQQRMRWLDGITDSMDSCEFEWTLEVGDGQGGLACWNSWGRKELDTAEWLNWTDHMLKWGKLGEEWKEMPIRKNEGHLHLFNVGNVKCKMCVCVCVCMYVYVQLLNHVWVFVTPWTVVHQTSVHGIFQARILESPGKINEKIFIECSVEDNCVSVKFRGEVWLEI